MITDTQGLVMCGRYSYGPNSLHYCGPERQSELLGYVSHNRADRGLVEILDRFETLFPYLTLIASQNNIKDPFDRHVVEAYWLGNALLRNVRTHAFAAHLADGLALKKKFQPKTFTQTMDRMITGGLPQHTFHVLNIFMRTGHRAITHTLDTMDKCRISWGKVTAVEKGNHIVVSTRPLLYDNGQLHLGLPRKSIVSGVPVNPRVGDWVSLHWGYVCDILTTRARINLSYYTKKALQLVNQHKTTPVTGL